MADLALDILIGLAGTLTAVVWVIAVIGILRSPHPYVALFAPEHLPMPKREQSTDGR